jgi:hypothetical protein
MSEMLKSSKNWSELGPNAFVTLRSVGGFDAGTWAADAPDVPAATAGASFSAGLSLAPGLLAGFFGA